MNWKLVTIFAMYVLIFISGFIITIMLGITKSNFDGNCILYVEIKWKDITHFELEEFGSDLTCNFVIYAPVFICILFPFIMMLFLGYVIFQTFQGNKHAENRVKPMLLLMVNSICCFLIFVCACMVSTGRAQMCRNFLNNQFSTSETDASCYDLQDYKFVNKRYRTNSFVRDILLAEVTQWICLIWWLLLIVPEFIRLWRDRRNQGSALPEK